MNSVLAGVLLLGQLVLSRIGLRSILVLGLVDLRVLVCLREMHRRLLVFRQKQMGMAFSLVLLGCLFDF